MDDATAKALATDQIIDITTTGRASGEPRRIEIWFHRVDGGYYITGTPPRPRSWYANLVAKPEFVFHLKQSVTTDLPALARPVTDVAERTRVFGSLLAGIPQLTANPGTEPEAWIAQSPLVEVRLAG